VGVLADRAHADDGFGVKAASFFGVLPPRWTAYFERACLQRVHVSSRCSVSRASVFQPYDLRPEARTGSSRVDRIGRPARFSSARPESDRR
jgi:hypothetical protein